MPAEHAILGLLAESGSGAHGYDLARHFATGAPLGAIVRLEPGMLYHHLKKLDKAGWVSATVEQQGTRPPRQIYHLTSTGRAELERWLADPVERTREIRLEFLVKLFFSQRLQPERARELIAHQQETLGRNLASLRLQQAELGAVAGGDPDRLFSLQVLELRISQTLAALDWLNRLTSEQSEVQQHGGV